MRRKMILTLLFILAVTLMGSDLNENKGSNSCPYSSRVQPECPYLNSPKSGKGESCPYSGKSGETSQSKESKPVMKKAKIS